MQKNQNYFQIWADFFSYIKVVWETVESRRVESEKYPTKTD